MFYFMWSSFKRKFECLSVKRNTLLLPRHINTHLSNNIGKNNERIIIIVLFYDYFK